MTVVDYFNDLLARLELPGEVCMLSGTMTYVSPGMTLEMSTDRMVANLADEVESPEQVAQVLNAVGQHFLREIGSQEPEPPIWFDASTIKLYLMSSEQVREMERLIAYERQSGPTLERDMPVTFHQYGALRLSPTIDVTGNRVPVTKAICEAMGIDRNELFDIGLANLAAEVENSELDIRVVANGVRVLESEDPPASSLFLLPAFWEKVEFELGSAPAVRTVNGDIIAYAPSDDPEAMAELASTHGLMDALGMTDAPISDRAFVWNGHGFDEQKVA